MMIPSDHFVRFYNEVFKFLEAKSEKDLRDYWLEISRHQEGHCLELFKTKGLKGMYEYWEHIRIEENCDMTLTLTDDCLKLEMHKCPSLSKVLDNDATPSMRYCDHCEAWEAPLLAKAGYYCVYDLIAPDIPKCKMYIYKDKELCEKKRREIAQRNS